MPHTGVLNGDRGVLGVFGEGKDGDEMMAVYPSDGGIGSKGSALRPVCTPVACKPNLCAACARESRVVPLGVKAQSLRTCAKVGCSPRYRHTNSKARSPQSAWAKEACCREDAVFCEEGL